MNADFLNAKTRRSKGAKVIKTLSFLFINLLLLMRALAEEKPLYQNNFEKAEIGKVPDEFLVLDGQFAVKEENGNKFLELPGAPLDTFGVLFGPSEKEGRAVSV